MSIEHQPNTALHLCESADFLAKNWSELQREYGGKWVACAGRTVRLFGDDLVRLQERIALTCPEETLLVDYVPRPGEELDWN
jgi:hypothetical protein